MLVECNFKKRRKEITGELQGRPLVQVFGGLVVGLQ